MISESRWTTDAPLMGEAEFSGIMHRMKGDLQYGRLLSAAYRRSISEVERLREFTEYVLNTECWGRVLDGGDLQDKAEKLGLIVEVPADAEFRDEYDADTMFVPAWRAK